MLNDIKIANQKITKYGMINKAMQRGAATLKSCS